MLLALAVLVAVLLLAVAALVGWGELRRRRDVLAPAPRELLIVAPHPDDCVILAGELADQVLELGGSVHIVYVTLGAASEDDPRHLVRKREAEEAWRDTYSGRVSFAWLGLPQSERIGGPLAASLAAQERAGAALAEHIEGLPEHAAVVLPAHLEDHVDHRLSRTLTLDALARCQRPDLLVLESDTYNQVLSLLTSPKKALLRVLGALPLTVRLVMQRVDDPGGPTHVALLRVAGERRLEKKRERLRAHVSQNPNGLLVSAFGRPDRLHRISPPEAPRGQDLTQAGFMRIRDLQVDASVLLLWSALSAMSALVAAGPGRAATLWLGRGAGLCTTAAFALLALLFATRRRSPERLAVALGLLLGAVLVFASL